MSLALKAVFAHQTGQVKIRRLKIQSQFLVRLARGAGIG